MRKFQLLGVLTMLIAVAAFVGCKGEPGSTPKVVQKGDDKNAKKSGEDDHDHGPGPHNGTIIEFGKWHGEFTVSHKNQEATVYILGGDAIKPVAIQIEKPLLSIKSPQFQIELKAAPQEGDPAGKSSRYIGKHENFGKHQEFEGIFSGVVDGTPYEGDFKEKEHKDHKHDKK